MITYAAGPRKFRGRSAGNRASAVCGPLGHEDIICLSRSTGDTRLPEAILHVYGDFKWTGPSEPVVALCADLTARGWRSDLVCMQAPDGGGNAVADRAREAGLAVFPEMTCRKGISLRRTVHDFRVLKRLLRGGDYALVHCHGSWGHFVVGWVDRLGVCRVPVIRTDHGAREMADRWLWRDYFGPHMIDHLVVLSDRYRAQAVGRLGLTPEDVSVVRGAVDTEAFSPAEPAPGVREELGFGPEDVIIGVVARVQRHRRFEVIIEAAGLVRGKDPRVKVAVCGRGTHKRAVLDEPVARLGLENTVVSLGYRVDDYADVLATFDAGMMLVPGSDGSCRAAMEMSAMGKPMIAARRGTLPDIVVDGKTGIAMEDTPENLAEALVEMAADADRRREWGAAARERMVRLFSPKRRTDAVIDVYERVLDRI
jgi:glycosyltransferase involved in cell wall biosynthesis